MLLLLLSILGAYAGLGAAGPYLRTASGLIEWVLLALLGWNVFGPMIRG